MFDIEKPNICLTKYRKNKIKIRAILYNWTMADLLFYNAIIDSGRLLADTTMHV